MPRSPWLASPGCRKNAGVPVLASVAAILCATWPDLPMPVTTTRPRQARQRRQAAAKAADPAGRAAPPSAAASMSKVRRGRLQQRLLARWRYVLRHSSMAVIAGLGHHDSALARRRSRHPQPCNCLKIAPAMDATTNRGTDPPGDSRRAASTCARTTTPISQRCWSARAFEGLRPLARHQLVYRALGERMGREIHALSIEAYTPQEWAARARRGASEQRG